MKLKTQLLPYQIEAAEKMKMLKVGALFMDMGTGKTRTALEVIKHRMESGHVEQVLWMCPCSVKTNLAIDIEKHAGEIPDFIRIAGIESISSSGRIYLELIDYIREKPTMLIVDESSLVKNHKAKRTQRIIEMSKRCEYKLILNGTPISRNEADLYSQFYILDPDILGYESYYSFAANHLVFEEIKRGGVKIRTNRVVDVLDTEYLAKRIAPYTYQVKKEDCLDLPSKHYERYTFTMSRDQRQAYENAKWFYLSMVDDFDETTIYKLFTALQHATSGRAAMDDDDGHMVTKDIFESWADNPRISTLSSVISDIGDEKMIIFAKFDAEVKEISKLLEDREISYALFTGMVPGKQRQENLARFKSDTQVLIANKQCGAFGLNLQEARNIVFYDNDFNFLTRSQAEDRIHRLGQEQECHIYDIAAEGTIDMMISKNLDKKGALLSAFKSQIEIWKKEMKRFKVAKRKKLSQHRYTKRHEINKLVKGKSYDKKIRRKRRVRGCA